MGIFGGTSRRFIAALALLAGAGLGGTEAAQAAVFNTPHFLKPEEQAIGVEPELTLTSGAGLAATFRYSRGLSDINNGHVIVGTGGGPRKFRMGGNLTFDFFPDVEGQPGIGVAAQALYVRLVDRGQLELTGVPYIHKAFYSGNNEIDPFISVPIGIGFSGGRYQALSTMVVGSFFKASESMKYVLELGVDINHTESYLSGGVVFQL